MQINADIQNVEVIGRPFTRLQKRLAQLQGRKVSHVTADSPTRILSQIEAPRVMGLSKRRKIRPNPPETTVLSVHPRVSHERPTLDSLPHDILRLIIEHLKESDATIPLREVSRRFKNLVGNHKESQERALDSAIAFGSINLVSWYVTERKYQLDDEGLCATAAEAGKFEMLQWLRHRGAVWHADTCAYAADCGHLEMLKWAHQNGCPWDSHTCSNAAAGGYFEVLQWAHQNGCPWDEWAWNYAHPSVREWLKEKGCPGSE